MPNINIHKRLAAIFCAERTPDKTLRAVAEVLLEGEVIGDKELFVAESASINPATLEDFGAYEEELQELEDAKNEVSELEAENDELRQQYNDLELRAGELEEQLEELKNV